MATSDSARQSRAVRGYMKTGKPMGAPGIPPVRPQVAQRPQNIVPKSTRRVLGLSKSR